MRVAIAVIGVGLVTALGWLIAWLVEHGATSYAIVAGVVALLALIVVVELSGVTYGKSKARAAADRRPFKYRTYDH